MVSKETARKEVEKLIKKYELLLQEGRVRQYQEANTRKDFILPLFAALGWEITNIDEVDEETAVSRGRVDYSFKLSGVARFYLEAKALKIDLNKQEYAEQAIDYAYNKGVPWAVLTDFEKIKVFNAEWKAKTLTDSQFFELAYNEYLNKFDQLWLLSKEAISQGLLDKEAERWGKKDKKQPISKQILADLLKAREKLTKNILQHSRLNKISEEELDESVQRILDRLIFIRTCEDRNIEQNCLSSAKRLWCESRRDLSPALQKIFRDFDNGYNSKLFEKHLCENLTIDDEILAEIIQDLYQTPDGSRYDFSAISADVLGNIYEQYLGHILKKTPKSARLKETYQHRKEMGIYYTPTYIVDYIVKNTLGEILKKTKPKDVNKIKVLDPACGSGSFLIRAFNEFVNYWQKNSPGEFGYFRKIEILKNNLYGVDLDKQAIEITQMNLLLKTLYHRERLPMLGHIKQGNSLISGTEEELKKYFGDEWKSKHPFDWEDEFPKVFSREGKHSESRTRTSSVLDKLREESHGGFDVVIGNPPYVRADTGEEYLKFRRFMQASSDYETLWEKWDIYIPFIERGMKLLKKGGFLSFIISSAFATSKYAQKIIDWFIANKTIVQIDFFEDVKVFEGAEVRNIIIVLQNLPNGNKPTKRILHKGSFENAIELPSLVAKKYGRDIFRVDYRPEEKIELNRARTDVLGDICYISVGMVLNADEFIAKGQFKKEDLISETYDKIHSKKYVEAKDIGRFRIDKIRYLEWNTNRVPNKVRRPTFPELYEPKKILLGGMTGAIFDDQKLICNHSINVVVPFYSLKGIDNKSISTSIKKFNKKERAELENISKNYILKYLLGIINSKLAKHFLNSIRRSQIGFYPDDFKKLPIRKIDFSNPAEKKMHDDLVKLVDKMLDLNKQLQKFGDKLTDERRKIESEIQKTDKEIDELVYKLYGLTEEEIKIIEENI